MMSSPGTPDSAATTTPRRKILLVDDHQESSVALQKLLGYKGYAVTTVSDGASARSILESGEHFDVVLTDLLLPDIDGLEVGRIASHVSPRPFVALITGWSFEANLQNVEASGVDRLFLKPLDLHELLDVLREHFSKQGGEAP